MNIDLPELSAAESHHHQLVKATIRAEIKGLGGFMPFVDFMQRVLYAPQLGYYAVGTHKIGVGGDFITAPEFSPLFAQCLATQCQQIMSSLLAQGCVTVSILELGAGSGQMAFDVMTSLAAIGMLPEQYWIVEISPDLRERQRAKLMNLPSELYARIGWLGAPPQDPWDGILLANEVADALPVEWLTFNDGVWHELGIVDSGGDLAIGSRIASIEIQVEMQSRRPHPVANERRELCTRLQPWCQSVLENLRYGIALFIDYGAGRHELYSDDRLSGTLTCFFKHRQHEDVLANLGLQDITAWVDFTALSQAMCSVNAQVAGFTTQAAFLLHNDFDKHYAANLESQDALKLSQAARQLMLPTHMGERFKVLALAKGDIGELRGFSVDLRHLLGN